MKKFAAVLASLLVLACGTTAIAAPSADAEAYAAKVETATEGVTVEAVDADVVTEAQTKAAEEGTLLAVVEVTSTGAKTITFKVDGVKAGDNIIVLHQKADKTWEKITPDSVKDGEVTKVYIGKDAEEHVTAELIEICNENKIEIIKIETMAELGKLAGIDIGASAAAE